MLCCVDKQGILSWPNPSPETVLFFSGRVEPPHNSQDDLRDDLSVNSYCRGETEDDRDEVSVCDFNITSNPTLEIVTKTVRNAKHDDVRFCIYPWLVVIDVQVGEVQALLCLPAESSTQLGEGLELIDTSHDTICSSETLRLRRSCQPAQSRTKHHSGSNVSFSHDTEGGEDDQALVKKTDMILYKWLWM